MPAINAKSRVSEVGSRVASFRKLLLPFIIVHKTSEVL